MEEELQPASNQTNLTQWWIALVAAVAPFFIWPLEMLLPYPAVIEETAKLLMVRLVNRDVPKEQQLSLVLGIGILFGGSETLLYLFNAMLLGNLTVIVWRVLLTIPMHLVTTLVIFWGFRKHLWWLGWIVAMLIHGGFNYLVGSQ